MSTREPTLDAQLCFALYAATNAIVRTYRPGLDEIGLTYPQYLVMLVLWQDGPSLSSQIARRLGLGANAVTPLLDRLAAAGFIVRRRETDDRRAITIHLTHKGQALQSAAGKVQRSVVCGTGLAERELGALRDQLKELAMQLDGIAQSTERPDQKTTETAG